LHLSKPAFCLAYAGIHVCITSGTCIHNTTNDGVKPLTAVNALVCCVVLCCRAANWLLRAALGGQQGMGLAFMPPE
jgi:hypothetical protein